MARGDRRIGKVIEEAYRLGCLFDSWTESFRDDLWEKAFLNTGIEKEFYTLRTRDKTNFSHGILSIPGSVENFSERNGNGQ